jgi:hypothetical protein
MSHCPSGNPTVPNVALILGAGFIQTPPIVPEKAKASKNHFTPEYPKNFSGIP